MTETIEIAVVRDYGNGERRRIPVEFIPAAACERASDRAYLDLPPAVRPWIRSGTPSRSLWRKRVARGLEAAS